MEGPLACLLSCNLALPPARPLSLPPSYACLDAWAPPLPGADGARLVCREHLALVCLGLFACMDSGLAGGASHPELLQNSCADTAASGNAISPQDTHSRGRFHMWNASL